jgi:hypothetical protein
MRRASETLLVTILLVLVGFSVASGLEVAPKHSEHRLVRIKLEANESVAVLSRDFAPVDLVTIPGKLAAFTGPPGRYAIVVSRDGNLAGIVTTSILANGPDNPDDPDVPEPGPGPAPPTVPNKYGVGKVAYDAAVAAGDPAGAAVMAEVYEAAVGRFSGLNSGDIVADVTSTTAWIKSESRSRIEQQSKWDAWGEAVKTALQRGWSNGYNSREGFVGMLSEISAAMAMVR